MTASTIGACPRCGQVLQLPGLVAEQRWRCPRCFDTWRRKAGGGIQAAATLAGTALVLYPFAITLPIMSISRFGQDHAAGVIAVAIDLIDRGDLLVGLIVLLCSVVIPLLKLVALVTLGIGPRWLDRRTRAFVHRMVEWTGRWSMVDVLLVAVLLATLKLGSLVEVTPGPGLFAFTACVVLSLIASACVDHQSLWEDPL
ncbi:MAG: paraquat-inducible protein A [Planctomycetes bacterium]|nr:paraquat-inducible protein A [Planctomycetota bacterium]